MYVVQAYELDWLVLAVGSTSYVWNNINLVALLFDDS